MKTGITITCMDRPEYTRQVLDSIKNQNKDLSDYKLFVNIDTGNCNEVVQIFKDLDFMEMSVKVNQFKEKAVNKRVNKNTYDVVKRAFSEVDHILYLEDDIIISPDALDLVEWYRKQDLTDIATLCLCNIWDEPINKDLLFKARHSCLWGYSVNKAQFEKYYEPAWFTGYSWDTSIARHIRTFMGIHNLIPMFSRSHNIGENGVNAPERHKRLMEFHKYNTIKDEIFSYTIKE